MARRISSPILIGRELEVQAFRLALQEAADRRPGLILIGGEAGIGKSRLVSEYARLVRTSGGIAAIGAAPPPAGDVRVPLAALVAVLRGLLRAVDARLLDRILGPARLDLAALLPELGGVPADAPSPYPSTRLAEAVLVAIESVAQRSGPLLVVIEDLHWADDATRAVLMYTCRNLVDAPVVTVVTHRTDAYPAAGDIVSLLAEMGGDRNVERLDLEPLPPEAVEAQVRAILRSEPPPGVLRELVRRSGGIPFFLEELLE